MKSISKSYGVPGIRLGVLASGNEEMIAAIKKDTAIWNINSFAEFFLQILEKYRGDYQWALTEFLKERNRFAAALSEIEGIRIIPSQANYFMAEITREDISAKELMRELLNRFHILIKDLSDKVGERYIRIAVRNRDDNEKMAEALRVYFDVRKK